LNSQFIQKTRLAGKYAGFLLHSGNRYRVHSPFLFNLVEEVVRGKGVPDGFEKIEKTRQKCLKSREIINKTDYGGGGNRASGEVYPVELRHIARTSLTTPRLAKRLSRLAIHLKAKRILEIGTSLGITSAHLAMARPGSSVMTLEGCPELCRIARMNFLHLGLANIELIEGRFEDTLPEALRTLGSVDLVYIDGNHHKDAVLEYYEKCLPYVHNDTVIVFDDIRASAGMEQAWDMIRLRPEVRISLDFFNSGWVFFRKESSRQHFRLRYI
jgi:predicted O-methyltransferase YrrM